MTTPKFKFELDIEEVNAILLSLAKKPFEEVATLITKIHTAVKDQHEANKVSPPNCGNAGQSG